MQNFEHNPMPKKGSPEWETICVGCGTCCLNKTLLSDPFDKTIEHSVYLTTVACNYLDLKTKKCIAYKNERRKQKAGCGNLCCETIDNCSLVPRSCPYSERRLGKSSASPKIDWGRVIHERDIPHGKTLVDFVIDRVDYFRGI